MRLAGLYSKLPWRWVVTLTAPPGRLLDSWNTWQASGWDRISEFNREPPSLPRLTFRDYGAPEISLKYLTEQERLRVDRLRDQLAQLSLDAFPFWVAVVSAHLKPGKSRGRSIEGIVASGVPHIHMILGGIGYRDVRRLLAAWPWRSDRKAIYKPRSILHYIFAQALKGKHRVDPGSSSLLRPPMESWNLEAVLMSQRHRDRRKRRRIRRLKRRA